MRQDPSDTHVCLSLRPCLRVYSVAVHQHGGGLLLLLLSGSPPPSTDRRKEQQWTWICGVCLSVIWELNVPATCWCISVHGSAQTILRAATLRIQVAYQTFHRSQYTDTRPTSPSTDPITSGAWQGSHWYDSTRKKSCRKWNSKTGSSALEADAFNH